jgi:coatomer protein complex subunit gamma
VIAADPSTGELEDGDEGYEDQYPLEELEVFFSDFIAKVPVGDFRSSWEQMGSDGEVLQKFALQYTRLDEALAAVVSFMAMQPADGTGSLPMGNEKRSHTLHLSGAFLGNLPVLVRAGLQLDDAAGGVVLKMAIRSSDAAISALVSECVR